MLHGIYRIKKEWYEKKNILLKGTHEESRHLLLFCMQRNLRIAGFLQEGRDRVLHYLPVYTPEEIAGGAYEVVSAPEEIMERDPASESAGSHCLYGSDWEERRRELLMEGVPGERIFVDDYRLENCRGFYAVINPDAPLNVIRFHERQIMSRYFAGNAIFDRLALDRGTRYVFPGWRGKGDTVLICSLMEAYKEKVGCKRLVFLASRGHEEIVRLFPAVDGVLTMDLESRLSLETYLLLSPEEKQENLCFCGFGPQYCGLGRDWSILKGRPTMAGLFRKALGLEETALFQRIGDDFLVPATTKQEELFRKLQGERSVLVIPQAHGLYQVMDMDEKTKKFKPAIRRFLERLCAEWTARGYRVYCNIGNPEEPCIPGTVPLSLTIRELLTVCRGFSMIYTVRTGLADILALCGCRMRVLNPVPVTHTLEMFNTATDLRMVNPDIQNDYWCPEGEDVLMSGILGGGF